MAFTKLYLTTNTAPYTPATLRGAWDQTGSAVTRAFDTQKYSGGNITTIGIAETNAAANWDVLLGRWVSGPIAAQTFSGTLDCVIGLLESNAAADLALHIHAYVTQGDSDTVRGTLLADYVETTANEWPTTATGRAFAAAQTIAAVVASAGDRIVIEVGYVALNASATSYTGTINYGTVVAATGLPASDLTAGSTSVTTLAGFFQFSVSVDEATNPLRVSQTAVEVLANGSPSLRVSQTAIEVLWSVLPIDIPVGSLLVTGYASSPVVELSVPVPAGSVLVTGYEPTVAFGVEIPVGSVLVTGHANEAGDVVLPVPVGSVFINGHAPALNSENSVNVPVGSALVTGHAPSNAYAIDFPVGSVLVTGYAPFVWLVIDVPTGAVHIGGYATSIPSAIEVPPGSVLISGHVAVVLSSEVTIRMPVGSVLVSSGALSLLGGISMIPVGAVLISGHAPLLSFGPEVDLQVDAGATVNLTWVEFTDSSDNVHVWSQHALPDPSTYYHGWKEPRVSEWGDISRSLSDHQGQYVGSQAGWTCEDSDQVVRQALYSGRFYNRQVVIRTISDAQRRALQIPRTIFRGRVRGYEAK